MLRPLNVLSTRAQGIATSYDVFTSNRYYNRLVLDGTVARDPIASYTWRGHDYALFPPTSLGDARWLASTLSSRGRRGYLVTITSAAEDLFVANMLRDYTGTSTLGSSLYLNLRNSVTQWMWYDGPEAAQIIWTGKAHKWDSREHISI